MSNLVVLCGIQASGKSTTAMRISKETGAIVHGFDDFFSKQKGMPLEERTEQFYRLIRHNLMDGQDVIIDGLMTSRMWRLEFLNAIKDIPCKKTLLHMDVPFEICLKRNSSRERPVPESYLRETMTKFESPTLSEGWDEIIII